MELIHILATKKGASETIYARKHGLLVVWKAALSKSGLDTDEVIAKAKISRVVGRTNKTLPINKSKRNFTIKTIKLTGEHV